MSSEFYETVLTVRGAGPFPVDMLRSEACFPASEEDSKKILRTMDGDTLGHFTVNLVRRSASGQPANREAWRRCDWDVVEEVPAATLDDLAKYFRGRSVIDEAEIPDLLRRHIQEGYEPVAEEAIRILGQLSLEKAQLEDELDLKRDEVRALEAAEIRLSGGGK